MKEKKISSKNNFLPRLKREIAGLSKIQQRIARYILEHPEEVVRISISRLAELTGTKSESTIVRFYRLFGFTGYNDMKVSLATELAEHSYYRPYEDITVKDSSDDIKRKIFTGAIRNLEQNLSSIDNKAIEQAINILLSTKRLFIMGFSISYFIGEIAFFKFSKLIPSCYVFCDTHTAAAMMAITDPNDTLLAISHSGESRDLVAMAKKVSPTANVISLTSFYDSPLAQASNCSLIIESEDISFRTDAALARISQLSMIETLFLGLSVRMGEKAIPILEKSHLAVAQFKY